MIENIIAYHCGPALAGIKPSNIASCNKGSMPDIDKDVKRLNSELNSSDIYIEILCECEKRALIAVYRKNVLKKHLHKREMRKFLCGFGYPEHGSVADYIEVLRKRLREEKFPHEIGVFLGYPLHDIHGFIYHPDEGCLLTGEWKVYKDEEEAKKLFLRYRACRKAIVKRIKNGSTLAQIFCAS